MKKSKIIGISIAIALLLTSFAMAETHISINEKESETVNCSMQPPAVEWNKTYGGSEYDLLYCVQETSDGGYIAGGHTVKSDISYGWVVKIDSTGNEEWNATDLPGGRPSTRTGSYCVQETDDGGYIVCGDMEEASHGFVWKLDANGITVWAREYAEPTAMVPRVIKQVDDGYISSGWIVYDGYDITDAMLMKIDLMGELEWQKKYRIGADEGQYRASSFCSTNDGGYLINGLAEIENQLDYWMIKTDSSGNMEWSKTFGGPNDEIGLARNIFQTSDGGYIMNGFTSSYGAGKSDLWLVKTDSSGNMEWNETYGENRDDRGWSLETTNDDGYIMCVVKNYNLFGGTRGDLWVIRTDETGNVQWSQTFGGKKEDRGYCVCKTKDGGYILSGRTESFGAGDSDGWLIKLAPDTDMVPPEMTVKKPRAGYIFLFDILGFPFPFTQNALVLGDLTFTAECSDASGIEKVEFFIDGKVVETVTEGPYTCDWADAERGTCNLKIRAYNMYGGTCKEEITIQKIF